MCRPACAVNPPLQRHNPGPLSIAPVSTARSLAQVVQLLQDLDALAPKPLESSEPSPEAGPAAPPARRWMGPAGQVAVEAAVLRHLDSNAWSPQQAMAVVQVRGWADGQGLRVSRQACHPARAVLGQLAFSGTDC